MGVTTRFLCVTVLLGCASPAAPLSAPPAALHAPCAELAERYAPRHRLELSGHGRARRALVVRGARGAGVLLRAALHLGLGRAAALAPPADLCAAPSACRRGALRARAGGAPGRPRDVSAAGARAFLTLGDLQAMEPELPPCERVVDACAADAEGAAYAEGAAGVEGARADLAVLAARADGHALRAIQFCTCHNLTLTVVLFKDSCFRKTLQYLDERKSSYLFVDKDLEINVSQSPRVHSVNHADDERCPSGDELHGTGEGAVVGKYAPKIARVIEKYCPSLKDLQEITRDVEIEAGACKWALKNNATFESWIIGKYVLIVFLCTDDRLNEEYIYTLKNISSVIKTESVFDITFSIAYVDCRDEQSMTLVFNKMLDFWPLQEGKLMGMIAWSSSEGVVKMAAAANEERVPLVLAGPVARDAAPGGAVAAVGGRLEQLARAYRAFIRNSAWSRLAILSDGSAYAKSFTKALLNETDFIHAEKIITSETIDTALRALRDDAARVIIVNTNPFLADKIIQSASEYDMTPPLYAWLLRESSARRGAVPHYSLGTAWRGAGGAGEAGGGHAAARLRLRALWPAGAWPARAAPLADALLSLHASFRMFEGLYSSTPGEIRGEEYAMNISQILDETGARGIQRNLSFLNGVAEEATVYLEKWGDGERDELTSWALTARAPPGARCPERVSDRPACSFPAGGGAFVQHCYDVQIYSLFVVLALVPVVSLAARCARLKRLQVRDLNLLAQISESGHLSPVVRGDSLCILKKIGTGNFGDVYLATLRQSREKPILVAAKTLRDDSCKEEYLHEAGTLQLLDHENIVKFVGICVSNGSLLILMEYAEHGDLLQYLRARRHLAAGAGASGGGEAAHVGAQALTRLAREAAGALRHLARCGLVHRDVRAANCLIDERRTLKLADFGMARRVCDNREYTTIRCAMFPVLWMAPESLSHGTFSSASDIWSLGVLCLELATLGARPYGTCAPYQVLAYVRSGGSPPLPPDASAETVALVTECWHHDAAQRARAGDVERFLLRRPYALRPALLPAPDPTPPAPDVLPAPDPAPPAPDVLPSPTAVAFRGHSPS